MNRREQANEQYLQYVENIRKRNKEGCKIPFETDEKGRYYSLLFDKNNGTVFTKDRQELFEKLNIKYGKKNKC